MFYTYLFDCYTTRKCDINVIVIVIVVFVDFL